MPSGCRLHKVIIKFSNAYRLLIPRRPDLITLVFSDVGSLTPEGVSQYLVGMFAG